MGSVGEEMRAEQELRQGEKLGEGDVMGRREEETPKNTKEWPNRQRLQPAFK